MSLLVAFVGVFLLFVGAAVLISPSAMRQTVSVFLDRKWMPVASIVRIVLGLVCIFAAGETRLPTLVLVSGIMFVVAGVLIPIVGFQRIERFVKFWLQQPDAVIRLWGLVTMAFGGVLAWAGL